MRFTLVLIAGVILALIATVAAYATVNRVEETDASITYTGGWTHGTTPIGVYSGGSYLYSSATNASVMVAFMGTSLDWIATKNSIGGTATVTVDRGTSTTVDLHAASPEYQAKVWGTGTLPDGFHIVQISRVTGTINVDAFDLTGALVHYVRLEQSDSNITKTGTWNDYAATGASGGSYGRSSTAGASASVWFNGTKIAWIGMKGTTPGIVDVYLDDVKEATLDLYAPIAQYGVTLWTSDDLTSGRHHLQLVRNKDSLPTEFIVLDAIDIWGGGPTIAPPAITSLSPSSGLTLGGTSVTITGTGFDSPDTAVTFDGTKALSCTVDSGTQITAVSPYHSAGTVRVTVTTTWGGSSADTATDDYTYVDPGVPAITGLSPATGLTLGGTSVIINGSGFTDTVGSAAVTFGGLDATSYTVNSDTKITATAPPHDAGTVPVQVIAPGGTTPDTGADDYTYTVAPVTTRVDVKTTKATTTPGFTWSGTWASYGSASAYGASYLRSSTAGASVLISFKGTQLDWVSMKGTTGAKADIYLDGSATKAATIDLYASKAVYQQNLWSTGMLPDGYHTVKIVRDPGSVSGRFLTIDAVEVAGTLLSTTRIEDSSPAAQSLFLWSPVFSDWYAVTYAAASGGSYRWTDAAHASVTINFTGMSINVIAATTRYLGNMSVTLDGTPVKTVDLYSATTTYQKTVYSSGFLPPGNHTLFLSWTGNKNLSSTGFGIDIDRVDLLGELG
jgi:hypothetical protein